jgi:hypothetical protein
VQTLLCSSRCRRTLLNLIDQEHDGKRGRLLPAIFHHLRDERKIPLKVIQEKTGVKIGQINRSANSFKDRKK